MGCAPDALLELVAAEYLAASARQSDEQPKLANGQPRVYPGVLGGLDHRAMSEEVDPDPGRFKCLLVAL